MLHKVIAGIQPSIPSSTLRTGDVRCQAVQLLALHQFHGAANQCGIRNLDVRVDEKHVRRGGETRSVVSAYCGQAPADDFDIQPLGVAARNIGSAIGRVGVSQVHLRSRYRLVILQDQRGQQVRDQLRLVLRRDNDRQLAHSIHGCSLLPHQP